MAVVAALAVGTWKSTPRAPAGGPDVAATVAAAVQATVQIRAQVPTTNTSVANIEFDERFSIAPKGWPNDVQSTAWYAEGLYQLAPREPAHFVAIDAPLTDAFHDGIVSARFHKSGGPSGGGYGLIVADQGPEVHDGLFQGGRFVVLEVGDLGTVGAWEHDADHWVDLQPWTFNAAVHEGDDPNDLDVRADGQQLTFSVNGTEVERVRTSLPAGRIGVFVGGDGNQVVLEHFAAHWSTQAARPSGVLTTSPATRRGVTNNPVRQPTH